MKSLLKSGLFIWYFFLVNDLIYYFYQSPNESRLLLGLAFSIFLCLPLLIFKRYFKVYLIALTAILIVPSIVCFIHFILFKKPIETESFYPIYETNFLEIKEFFNTFFSWKAVILLVLYISIPIFIFLNIKEVPFLKKPFYMLITCSFLLLLAGFRYQFKFSYIKEDSYLIDFAYTFKEYKTEIKKLSLAVEHRKYLQKPFSVSVSDSLNATIVLVIGESISKHHMGLYGYQRKTTPFLSSISDELIKFDSVISPYSHTYLSLKSLLTFCDRKSKDSCLEKPSLIALFNAANYSTYWISNQHKIGSGETDLSVLASEAKHVYFSANDIKTVSRFDEVLLPKMDEVLKNDHQKKLIIVHMMGAHEEFKNRYPRTFSSFTNSRNIKDKNQDLSDNKIQMINAYDNAILYHDFVVSNMIKALKKNASVACLVYLSDHGEEVYEERDVMGHGAWVNSHYTYDVPFFIWFSEKYLALSPDKVKSAGENISKPYCTEHVIHSLCDLAGIGFKDLDSTKSIFFPNFISRNEYRHW